MADRRCYASATPPIVIPALLHPLLKRLLMTGLPAMLVMSFVASTIWGEHGLMRRLELERELHSANAYLAEVERENQRLLRELSSMDRDPVVLERIAADELKWGQKGAVLFRFDDPSQ